MPTKKAAASTNDDETPVEMTEPLTGDDLVEAVIARHDQVNEQFSSYDQGRKEELAWVLSVITPQPKAVEDEEAAEEEELFAEQG